MDNQPWYFVIGFMAQALFSARVLVQWALSEKEKRVVSPSIYWYISLLASILFSIYGWLRGDFAIIFGQLITYYIYIWNLKVKNRWQQIPNVFRYIILAIPIIAFFLVLNKGNDAYSHLFENISLPLLLFGSVGQIFLTLRFVYQWWHSKSRDRSILPIGFWVLSIIGATVTIVYGIYRKDPVLIVGHGAGLIAYSRNLWLAQKVKR